MEKPETRIGDVIRDHPNWLCIAVVDESESYEVDVTEVWQSPDRRLQLVTATGCSCWDGEYNVEGDGFESLTALRRFLEQGDTDSGFNPSVKGRETLLAAVMANPDWVPDQVSVRRQQRSAGASDGDIAAVEKLLGRNPPGWN